MAFLKRTFVVILSYIVACFAAGVVWLILSLMRYGAVAIEGYGAADLLTMTGFVFVFAGLGALIAILIAEWRGFQSRFYYAVMGIAVAFFTVGWFAHGAFEPSGTADYLAYGVSGCIGGLVFHAFARRARPTAQIAGGSGPSSEHLAQTAA